MDRDKQIELLVNAQDRVQGTIATWLQDERVKSAVRQNHKLLKGQRTPPLKRACG